MFRSRFIGAREAAQLGFVNLVVSRERLESETMALANEIAANVPFTLRMLKWAANSAQDAMGFSHSIRNAHSHYMVQGLDSFTKDKLEGKGFPKVRPGVARALRPPAKSPSLSPPRVVHPLDQCSQSLAKS
jgi:1,4-dihydroxy-2-naphthoyl-CoA synthase